MPVTGPGSGRPLFPWDIAILRAWGAKPTTNNRQKLWSWTTAELGGDAKTGGWDYKYNVPRWNWFDSTLPWPGSRDCGSCSQSSVQTYATPADGVAATVYTFLHSSPSFGYGAILDNLRRDGPISEFQQALANSCIGGCGWGGYTDWAVVTSNPSNPGLIGQPQGGSSGGNGGGSGSGSAAGGTSGAKGGPGCDAHAPGRNDNLILVIPHTDTGLSRCQLKAMTGALEMGGGALLMLVGVVVIASGTGVGKVASKALTAVGPAKLVKGASKAAGARKAARRSSEAAAAADTAAGKGGARTDQLAARAAKKRGQAPRSSPRERAPGSGETAEQKRARLARYEREGFPGDKRDRKGRSLGEAA